MNKLTKHLEILGLSELPLFADLFLEDFNKRLRDEDDFVVEIETISNTNIDLSKVVGTTHPDYINMTWSKLLTNAKRIKLNLNSFQHDPMQYIENHCKGIKFCCFDEDHLYIEAGNHRTCIALFHLHGQGNSILHGPQLRKYKTDLKFKTAFRQLESTIKYMGVPEYLSVIKFQTYSDYKVPGVFVVTSTLKAKLVANGMERHLDVQGIYEHIDSLKQQQGLFRRLQKWLIRS